METTESIVAPDYIPPYPYPEPGFLGQDHSYTVVFRGNGEAVVSAKIVFTNKGETDLSDINLRIPRIEPRNLSVYQVIMEKRCIRYEPREYDPITRTYKPQVCAEYQDPDYYQSYYGAAKYQKAEFELDIDTLKITLPVAIKSNKSGGFFVYFRALGYAKKNIFGVFNYVFETLKAEDDIRNLGVGISTDSDLVLRGVKGEIEYRFEEPSFAGLESAGAALAPQKSVAIDRFYQQIGQGRITKTASNLAPLESFKVEGSYAKNRLRLYAREILIGVGVLVGVVAVLVLIFRFIYKKLQKVEKETKELEKTGGKITEIGMITLASAGVGFVSSFLIAGYTIGVIFLGSLLTSFLSYQYDAIVVLFLVIISFFVYILLLFAPAIYLGVKRGVSWGMATAVATIIWLIIFLTVALFIIFLLGNTSYPGPIRPLLEGLSK